MIHIKIWNWPYTFQSATTSWTFSLILYTLWHAWYVKSLIDNQCNNLVLIYVLIHVIWPKPITLKPTNPILFRLKLIKVHWNVIKTICLIILRIRHPALPNKALFILCYKVLHNFSLKIIFDPLGFHLMGTPLFALLG